MRKLKEILNGEDEQTFLLKCATDFRHWGERVCGLIIEPFHLEWIDAMKSNKRVAITAPTGFGKTEIVIAYILWRCWFQNGKGFLIVSRAIHQSTKILDRIADAIENNEMLKDLMPDNTVKSKTWTKTEIKTKTMCWIACKPYSPNIKSYHVDFILCDEAASYPDHDIFFRFVVTRTNAKLGTVVCISTPDDISDLMSTLAMKKAYWTRTYPAILPSGDALWPKKFGLDRLEEIRDDLGEEAFQREYMCNPKAQAANAIYPPDLIESCFDYKLAFLEKRVWEDSIVIIGADFAISGGPQADFDSYIVIEKKDGVGHIRHGETHRGYPINSKVDKLIELWQQYGALKVYIDPSSIGAAVLDKLKHRGVPVIAPDFTPANRGRMLMSIRDILEERRLIIPRDVNCFSTMKYTNKLIQELLAFKEEKTLSRNDTTFKSKSAHDDTVMSLALAAKGMEEAKEFLDFVAV